MCGICGKLEFDRERMVPPALIEAMAGTLAQRGPDEAGYYHAGNLGLGFRRLSIIDLATGQQPIRNEDGSVVAVCNGEIYNYRELRERLRGRHRFRTTGDAEVIVHAYEEWGPDFIERLNGIFAMALWDGRRRSLLLIRDRLGVKPLFYAADSRRLSFGSEIKAVLQDDSVSNALDPRGLIDYLQFYYSPDPRTIYRDIRSLPPGHLLTVGEDGAAAVRPYWEIRTAGPAPEPPLAALEEKLRRAVRGQLVSDVPVGVFLSGGIDSSVLCALYADEYGGERQTFSAGFAEASYSELAPAGTVAKLFNTRHRELELTRNDRMIGELERLLLYFDVPFGDPSAVPFFYLARLARSANLKVVLSGDGADEIFGGYETYQADLLVKHLQRLPAGVIARWLKPLAELLPVSQRKLSFEYRLKRLLEYATLPPFLAHCSWRTIFNARERAGLVSPDLLATVADHDPFTAYRHHQPPVADRELADQGMVVDTKVYLPADLLTKVDRMGMMNSLEVRVPYLDHELVEFAFRLPLRHKVTLCRTKILLRELAARRLPRHLARRRKQGFNIPVGIWVGGFLRDWVRAELLSDAIRASGLFTMPYLQNLLDQHSARTRDNGYEIWALLSFCVWYNRR